MMNEQFDGETFVGNRDGERLSRQLDRVREVMIDGQWRTFADIQLLTGFPAPSISARLRDLRKPRFGGFLIERKYVSKGLFAYRMLQPPEVLQVTIPIQPQDVSGLKVVQTKQIDEQPETIERNILNIDMPAQKKKQTLDELFWK